MSYEFIDCLQVPAHRRRDAGVRTASPRQPLARILLVADESVDLEPCTQALVRGPFDVCRPMTSSAQELAALCLEEPSDAIVCDGAMSDRVGLRALELIRQRDPDIPFIVLIDTFDANDVAHEDLLTAYMLRGATDCVDKNNLHLLPIAVAFALEERALCEELKRIEQELARARARYQALSVTDDRKKASGGHSLMTRFHSGRANASARSLPVPRG